MKRPTIILIIGLLFIAAGSWSIHSWYYNRDELSNYSYLKPGSAARVAGQECGVKSQKLKLIVKKGVWANPGVWINSPSLIRVTSLARQPFTMKVADTEQKAILNGSTFMTYQALVQALVDEDFYPVTVDDSPTGSNYIVNDNFVISPKAQNLFVQNGDDAAVEQQEVFICIDEIVYIKKSDVGDVQ